MDQHTKKLVRNSLLNNQILGAFLVVSYCVVYGISATYVLEGLKLLLFLCSLIFALSIFYIRDPAIKKENAKKSILYSQIAGTVLVFAYIVLFGVSSVTLLNGFQLIFFMSSYAFAISIFYIRDPERIKKSDEASASITNAPFVERNPCFINNRDLSWLVRELNTSLTTIVGFTELMLEREFGPNEKEFMLRNIYSQAITMSYSIGKVSSLIPDSPTKPRDVHEVVDLLADSNFK